MKTFGFLSFGHYIFGSQCGPSAEKVARTRLEITQAADETGVNNVSFRVHHSASQVSAPMPLLYVIAAVTKIIEVGTSDIDMRWRISRLQRLSHRLPSSTSTYTLDRRYAFQDPDVRYPD